MSRVTDADVSLIIDTDLTSVQIVAFLDDASAWVDANLVGKGLSGTVLAAIEKYLAAHFICANDPRLTSASVEDASERFQRDAKVDEYLKKAAAFDTTGTVEDRLMEGRPQATFRVAAGFDDQYPRTIG